MSPLHDAAAAGDLAELRRLVAGGAEIDARDKETGQTALMAACLRSKGGLETVRFLLSQGADPNARARPDDTLAKLPEDFLDSEGRLAAMTPGPLEPEMIASLNKAQALLAELKTKMAAGDTHPGEPVIGFAIEGGDVEIIRLLLDQGVNLARANEGECTLLTLAAYQDRMDIFEILWNAGAPVDGESCYRESALSVLSNNDRFLQIGMLLEAGVDPSPLQWSPLHRAVAIGTVSEIMILLDQGSHREETDGWERTPFLLSLLTGDREKMRLLLDRGASREAKGRCGKPPMFYPVSRDDAETLKWLIENGFEVDATDQFENTTLMEAAEQDAVSCFKVLIAAGADWKRVDHIGQAAIKNASHPEIIRMLLDLGEELSELEPKALRDHIGLGNAPDLPISRDEFFRDSTRRFGTSNPERMDLPFWQAMVRCGWDGYQAASQFGADCSECGPVWCHARFGMSLTPLPDGRFVQIAGEHEDHYDPDFCIYNDVIIHDGKGGFEILGYPEDVFPPTDFHSATLIGPWIYILGNLGHRYITESQGCQMPVYRLHTVTWHIESVETSGGPPGRIHEHSARLVGGQIHISGGKIISLNAEGTAQNGDNGAAWSLDPETRLWQPLNP